jgi:hypothetical protein
VALLAESLVEEWLNRQNFFTIRGVKHGIDEIDLLAIKASAPVDGWHVEVQVSFRPVGYIAKLSNAMRHELKRAPTSAMRRTSEQIKNVLAIGSRRNFDPSARSATIYGLESLGHFISSMAKSATRPS